MTKNFLAAKERKIYDPVHGFIRFDHIEKQLINSYPFQRLHYIHQLGISYLVYPGATHTRFEHSIGVMELATRIFTKVCKSTRPDLFHFVPRKGSPEYLYWRRILRLAALCHDLGHLPFSHVAERYFLKDEGHETWTAKVIRSSYLHPVWELLREIPDFSTDKNFIEDIIKIALGNEKWRKLTGNTLTPWEKVVSECLTGDFFGADRIDYLLRDAKSTGVAYGLFDYQQLIEMLRILPSQINGEQTYELGIDENGIESCEALLLARHFMHRRVYQYSSVVAYNFHLRNFMKKTYRVDYFNNLENFLALSDVDVISEMNKAARDPSHTGHFDAHRIVHRSGRFKVIPLYPEISEELLVNFKNHHKIPEHCFSWELHPPKQQLEGWTFPVSKKYLIVEPARNCSEFLQSIPNSKKNWVYIAPEYEMLILESMEKWKQ